MRERAPGAALSWRLAPSGECGLTVLPTKCRAGRRSPLTLRTQRGSRDYQSSVPQRHDILGFLAGFALSAAIGALLHFVGSTVSPHSPEGASRHDKAAPGARSRILR